VAGEKEPTSPLDIVKIVIVVGTAVGLLVGGATWVYQMTSLIATKNYHEADQQAFEQKFSGQLDNIEVGVVVKRIQGIINAKCQSGTTGLDQILFEQLGRYRKLAGREYSIGECEDGTDPEVPVLP
jgi:hypothetical protein